MVDPNTNSVIAMAHSDGIHPLQHAVMKCIDLVSLEQGGGVWQNKASSVLQKHNSTIIHSLTLDEQNEFATIVKKRPKTEAYLCKSYDLYTTHEPCVM